MAVVSQQTANSDPAHGGTSLEPLGSVPAGVHLLVPKPYSPNEDHL